MKKILLAAVMAMTIWGCAEDRGNILKVYNWAEYIDEELLDEFEEWYFDQTGEDAHERASSSYREEFRTDP